METTQRKPASAKDAMCVDGEQTRTPSKWAESGTRTCAPAHSMKQWRQYLFVNEATRRDLRFRELT